ncbi:MAG: sulfurtransferase TusA family protein [Deltaproteobacteria bacterium]|nr:sulfurtransferase TusA family protein [Deltaproteobacteria bacterium]
MAEIVDARGLSCPQPVLLTLSRLKEIETGEIEVVVDNETSRENVGRAAISQGWLVDHVVQDGDEYRLRLKRS